MNVDILARRREVSGKAVIARRCNVYSRDGVLCDAALVQRRVV